MKVINLLLFCCLISVSALSGLEFVSEHIAGEAKNLILIPYSDLFFHLAKGEKIFGNSISIVIFDEADQIIYQTEKKMRIVIQPEVLNELQPIVYNREFFPISFATELEAGEYHLYIAIIDGSTSNRREHRENFIFPAHGKDVGFLFLKARIGEFEFVIRDPRYLYREYDELQSLQQIAFQPDSVRVLIDIAGEREYLAPEELGKLTDLLEEGVVFRLEVEHFRGGRKYVTAPIYPNSAYFFQQKYRAKDQLAQLRYILNQNEYHYLRSLVDDRLQNGINDYWRSRDPDPYTTDNVYQETFYRRIRYADNNYQIRRYLPGWRTDMGRIYIIYGEPDQILSDVFPVGRLPSITWYYYSLNKVFVFYDFRGYGNYELRNKWMD